MDERTETGTHTLEEPVAPVRFEVGAYQVEDEIGRGGMGVVYRARHRELDRVVALKRPRQDLVDNPRARKRFTREARSAARLIHPGIATIFEVFEEDGVPWLAMELVEGRRLASALGDGPMPVEEVVRHGEVLADALAAAHRAGILHRDINPNNVLIGSDGRARLTDFGLARSVEGEPGTICTETGMVVGTRGYMSPEQALGKPLDGRSDLFNLGLVLYEMCTGRRAFGPSDTGEWLDNLLHSDPTPLAIHDQSLPEDLVRIVDRALAKRPGDRYRSAEDMRNDLRSLRRSVESEAFVIPTMAHRRRRRWLSVGAAAIALVVLAAGWRLTARPEASPGLSWTPRQLTSAPGWEAEPALSPDGTLIAYASDESGNADIWLMDASGGETVQLTDHPAPDHSPAWLPDGSAVLFTSLRMGEPGIWRVPRLGGTAVEVVADAEEPAVSPDGERIAFARKDDTGDLRIVVAPMGEPDRATVLTGPGDGLWEHRQPAWSPDGKLLVYRSFQDLWVIQARGGAARRLTNDHAGDLDPVWSADGRWLYFASMREDTTALWRVLSVGGEPQRLTMGTGPERHPSLAPTGGLIAYSTFSSNEDVEILDRVSGERWRVPGRRVDREPALVPDGSGLVFVSDRGGGFDLWVQALADGEPHGAPRQLTDLEGNLALPSVSPDGRYVAFHRVIDGQRDIWIVPIGGGRVSRFTDNAGFDFHPAWSPDGKQLAYVSDSDGREHVWVAPVEGGQRVGEPVQVTWGDAMDHFPEWLANGQRIAFVRLGSGDAEVWLADLGSAGEAFRLTTGVRAEHVHWDSLDRALLVSGRWRGGRLEVRRVSAENGESHVLEPGPRFGTTAQFGQFSVGGGGRLIAYTVLDAKGDLWTAGTRVRSP